MGASRKCPDMLGGRCGERKPTHPGLGRAGAAAELGARRTASCHRRRLLKGWARGVGRGSCLWLLLFPALPPAASGGGGRKAGTVTAGGGTTSPPDALCVAPGSRALEMRPPSRERRGGRSPAELCLQSPGDPLHPQRRPWVTRLVGEPEIRVRSWGTKGRKK